MMEAAVKIPLTRAGLWEIGPGLVRFPASWDEYWQLLDKAEYNIEYQNGEIIAMGYESNEHGNIIFKLNAILDNLFGDAQFQGFCENRPVYIQSCRKVFNPDVMLIDGPSELFQYSPGLNAETNPFIVVEVLSKTTYDHDWEDKLPCYQELPSVEHILFVESRFPAVTHFVRQGEHWKKFFFNEAGEMLEVRSNLISIGDIYKKTDYFSRK